MNIFLRPFWVNRVREAWRKRPIVWLSGVRRVGKTTLARMLPDAAYMNCELPSVSRALEEPEYFFDGLGKRRATLILDEVHRLEDPSRVLKIAADEYRNIKILATGSSTLSITRKFRDTLTGRKQAVYLSPILWTECADTFRVTDLDRRMLRGGLPEPLLSTSNTPEFYAEWTDSFYARDIQELFSIRNRSGFLKLFRLLLLQSGGLLEYDSLARQCELSRPTVVSHLEAMSLAHSIFIVPPFHGNVRREIVKRPKCYAFDTGFVAYVNGWDSLRPEDRGSLWEHIVLDCLRAVTDDARIFYWRDKSRREIDFVIRWSGKVADTIECKISPDNYDPEGLTIFRSAYPMGKNWIVSPTVKIPYHRRFGKLKVQCAPLAILQKLLRPDRERRH